MKNARSKSPYMRSKRARWGRLSKNARNDEESLSFLALSVAQLFADVRRISPVFGLLADLGQVKK
jgi:hypothetical protein